MTDTRARKVCIIGAGAIGGYFGVRLAQAGAAVSAIARGRTLVALRARGWALESNGQRIVAPVHAESDPSALGPQDVVLLTVKAYALPEVAPLLQPLLGPSTLVVPAVNGVPWWFAPGGRRLMSVDPCGAIEAAIPAGAVIGSVVYLSCSCPEPGVTRHASGTRVVFGEPGSAPGADASARLSELVLLMQAAGIEAEASTDIRNEVWKKLLGNACFNPVSLITGSATDLLIDDPRIHAMFVTMMTEALALGRAFGIDVPIQPVDRIALTRKLGNIKTSTLQDAEANRTVEIEAIIGALVELAESAGVPTPVCRVVYALARMRAKTFGLLPD